VGACIGRVLGTRVGRADFGDTDSRTWRGTLAPHAHYQIGGDNPFDWKDVTSSDLFKGKRVVIFSLPGAFTPTCSSTHLPGYEAKYEEIKACGIPNTRVHVCATAQLRLAFALTRRPLGSTHTLACSHPCL
jgi:hypothetical protein